MAGYVCETLTELQNTVKELEGLIRSKDQKIKDIEDKPLIQKKVDMLERTNKGLQGTISEMKVAQDRLVKERNNARVEREKAVNRAHILTNRLNALANKLDPKAKKEKAKK